MPQSGDGDGGGLLNGLNLGQEQGNLMGAWARPRLAAAWRLASTDKHRVNLGKEPLS